MKKLFITYFLLISGLIISGQDWTKNLPKDKVQNGTLTFYELQKAFNDYWEPFNIKDGYYIDSQGEKVKAGGWKQFRRWEWYWENRIVKETGLFPETSASEELEKYLKENPAGKSGSGNWTSLGPTTTTGGYAGLGRLNCVGFVSGDNNSIYVGSASGGIWKTTNGGTSWTPLGDNNAVLGVSDIVVVPGSSPHTIYIATGDRDGGSLWALGGGQSNDNNSVGVLKSIDGGATWNSTGLSFTASQHRTVNRILLHPSDNNILYAATSVGVYKTINGGTSWTLLTGNVYIDLEFKPGTPATLYGSNWNGDIYRSINDGTSWTATLSTSYSRTELAVSANNTAIVYAIITDGSGLAGIYKSTDSGATFTQVFSGATTNMLNWDCGSTASGGQGWYDLCIAADPTNANNVFIGGVNTWKSTNGGTSWSICNHWTGSCSVSEVHADQHNLAFQNGTSTLFECNDGGFYKSTNLGTSWSHVGNGLAISQIYRMAVAQTVSNENICGLQDNGTKAFLSGLWNDEIGGDGFDCAIDYTTQNVLYGELYYGAIRRSTNHGVSWSDITTGLSGSAHWCTPLAIDPTTHSTIFIGYQDVFKSTNQGSSWSQISSWGGSTLKSLAVAPSNSLYIYAATSGILYRTTNGGTSWTNITGTIPVGSGDITYICIKNDDPNTAWVSLGGYNTTRVYQTINGGTSWTNISTGLPSIPVMSLVQNKQNTSQVELYAGTDVGVFVKAGSANWSMFSTGLPNVVVADLDIYYNATPANSRIRAGTYGRGVWQSDLLTAATAPVANFSASTTTPFIGQTVTFTDLSTNSPTSWSWSFNPATVTYTGGTSSTSQNPQVQFTAGGLYTVTLTATNGGGSDQEVKTNYISVLYTPVADFSSDNVIPLVGQTVGFTDLSTNSPTTWLWVFAPSTVTYTGGTTSASQNPQVQFNAAGFYSVSLTAVNASGPNTMTKTDYINAQGIPPTATLKLGSITNPAPGTVLVPVTLEAINNPMTGNNLISSWSWYIAYEVNTLYNAAPMTPANLTNYNAQFPSANYVTNIIENNPSPGWNTIAVIYSGAVSGTGSVGMKFFDIVFTYTQGTSVCPNLFWTSTPGKNTKQFSTNMADDEGNEFLLTLINGCVWTDPPVTDFVASTTTPYVGATVNFSDLSTNYPSSWSWSFAPSTVTYTGGTTSASQNPQVQFNAAGNYTATLIAANAVGNDTEIKADYIVVSSAELNLELTLLLEGPFDGVFMTTSLNGILPLSQPYTVAPWNYNGAENVASIPNTNVVDWILVELRDAPDAASANAATRIARQAGFLLDNGSVTGLDGSANLHFTNTITQQLFVVVHHRNHLSIISANPVTESGGIYTLDFSSAMGQAWGGALAQKELAPGAWGMFGADGDKDGQITFIDYSPLWEDHAGGKGYLDSDYNMDIQSDNQDKDDIWTPNQGEATQVPE